MRNRITKLATAAVVAIAVIMGVRGFNGTTAWAKVIKAMNNAENIHVITKVTRPNGRVDVEHAWLKDRTMFREDETDEVMIDDGHNRLNLDLENKTARLSDSESPFKDYMEDGQFEIILFFSGEETPYKATELPSEHTDTMRVFEISYGDPDTDHVIWKGKAWVDAKSNLPMRIVGTPVESYRQRATSLEIIYDYQPIPMDKFRLTIPSDYIELPRIKSRVFSGKVIDENGKPVIGADVVTSDENIRGQTGKNGEFVIKLHPGMSIIRQFPMLVRAFKSDDPNRVAWTLLRNPRHELRPRSKHDDERTKLEQGFGATIYLVDEKGLVEFIPGDPGKMVFEKETDRHPKEITDMVLQMGPASVITGRIVDQGGQPIANTIVWIDRMEIAVSDNEIEICGLGHTAKEREIISSLDREVSEEIERKTFAVTDKDGCYEIGYLPDVWYRVRLEVEADGYVPEAKEIFQSKGADFSLFRAGITLRGTVIDDHGLPLVGREVEIDVDSDKDRDFDVEEAITDAHGRFELTGVPAVDDLVLEIRTDEKPHDWDRNELTRDREFIYYLMIEKPIKLEPGKNEYDIKIVPHRPDIVLEIEVKDAKGNPLKGIPMGVCSPGFSERVWYLKKLNGITDEKGLCTTKEVPRIVPLNLWVGQPPERQIYLWQEESEVNQDTRNAIIECRGQYPPTVITVEVKEGKKEYEVSVML